MKRGLINWLLEQRDNGRSLDSVIRELLGEKNDELLTSMVDLIRKTKSKEFTGKFVFNVLFMVYQDYVAKSKGAPALDFSEMVFTSLLATYEGWVKEDIGTYIT